MQLQQQWETCAAASPPSLWGRRGRPRPLSDCPILLPLLRVRCPLAPVIDGLECDLLGRRRSRMRLFRNRLWRRLFSFSSISATWGLCPSIAPLLSGFPLLGPRKIRCPGVLALGLALSLILCFSLSSLLIRFGLFFFPLSFWPFWKFWLSNLILVWGLHVGFFFFWVVGYGAIESKWNFFRLVILEMVGCVIFLLDCFAWPVYPTPWIFWIISY